MNFVVEVDTERCKGCVLCISVCPAKVLEMAPQINKAGYHFAKVDKVRKCIGCIQCCIICPDAAIEVSKGDR